MNADEFRQLALSFPEAEERSHMDHPDFRVGGKIFATIAPDGVRGMVKLTPEQQAILTRAKPAAFEPASGAWGRNGSTMVTFANTEEATARQALAAAWKNTAPKRLLRTADF